MSIHRMPNGPSSDRRTPMLANFRPAPDRRAAVQSYATLAPKYDASCHWLNGVRFELLSLLDLNAGDVVVDAGCGTGAMLPMLSRMVGRGGLVVGIEQSPDMAALARERVAGDRFRNVVVLEAPAENAHYEHSADAVLFCYTHDLLQSEDAVANLLSRARPGATVVSAGACLAAWWAFPLNAWKLWRSRQYLSTFAGLRDPAARLGRWCPDWTIVATRLLGTSYIGVGHLASS